jgi:hypothetical protein
MTNANQVSNTNAIFSSFVGINNLLDTLERTANRRLHWDFTDREGLEEILNQLSTTLKFPELESIGQIGGVELVNQFLVDKGMNIQLDPISQEGIAAAIYFLLKSKWTQPGTENWLDIDGQVITSRLGYNIYEVALNNLVEAVEDEGQNPNLTRYIYDRQRFCVLELENGDEVIITLPPTNPSPQSLYWQGISLQACYMSDFTWWMKEFDGIEFPQVNCTVSTELGEIVGLKPEKSSYFISQALAETNLKVNELGVEAEVAMAASMEKSKIQALNYCRKTQKGSEVLASFLLPPTTWGKPEISF